MTPNGKGTSGPQHSPAQLLPCQRAHCSQVRLGEGARRRGRPQERTRAANVSFLDWMCCCEVSTIRFLLNSRSTCTCCESAETASSSSFFSAIFDSQHELTPLLVR